MNKIQKTEKSVKEAIRRKSAFSLPNNPSAQGYKASEIRNALYTPITDEKNSVMAELDRIVDEVNGFLGDVAKNCDVIVKTDDSNYYGSSGFVYSFEDEYFSVKKCDALESEMIIPSSVFYNEKYYPVEFISQGVFNTTVQKIIIPKTITGIQYSAFGTSLRTVKFLGAPPTTINANAFKPGVSFEVPKEYLSDYESKLKSFITISGSIKGYDTMESNTENIATLDASKLSKVTDKSGTERVYAISETGEQITKELAKTAIEDAIPVYSSNGSLPVGQPESENDAIPKSFLEEAIKDLCAGFDFAMDGSSYKLTFQLKNSAGEVLGTAATIDLPLESMIVNIEETVNDADEPILQLKLKNDDTVEVKLDDVFRGYATQEKLDEAVTEINNSKLSKITDESENARVYAISESGEQTTKPLAKTATADAIPVYSSNGRLPVGQPESDDDAIPKSFLEEEIKDLCAGFEFAMDESSYKLTLQLKNSNSEVLGEPAEIDLPIENAIVNIQQNVDEDGEYFFQLVFSNGDVYKLWGVATEDALAKEVAKLNENIAEEVTKLNEKHENIAEEVEKLNENMAEVQERIYTLHPAVVEYISMMPYMADAENGLETLNLLLRKGKKFHWAGHYDAQGNVSAKLQEIRFDFEWVPDEAPEFDPNGLNTITEWGGNIINFSAIGSDNYDVKEFTVSRGVAGFFIDPQGMFYSFPAAEADIVIDLSIVLVDKTSGEEKTFDTSSGNWLFFIVNTTTDELDGDGLDTLEVFIEKDDETAQFFPSTLDFRTQSIDRRLKATLEEAIAKRRAELLAD